MSSKKIKEFLIRRIFEEANFGGSTWEIPTKSANSNGRCRSKRRKTFQDFVEEGSSRILTSPASGSTLSGRERIELVGKTRVAIIWRSRFANRKNVKRRNLKIEIFLSVILSCSQFQIILNTKLTIRFVSPDLFGFNFWFQ